MSSVFSFFLAGFCSLCNENNAVCRCVSCGPRQQFCLDCAKQLHSTRNQFHLLEICKDGVFLPMYPDHCVVGYGHRCSTQNNRHVTLVDEFGVQHVKQVQFCNCESPAVTLIRCNFWPGSPERPVVGFSLKLMNLAEMLFLQSQVSLHDFTEVIKRLQHPLQPTVISSIYNILNSSCFDEFRYFKYHLKHLHKYCSGLNDGFTCPLCPKSDGVVIESMDACMGLTRKKAKGTNVSQPRHGTLVFSDQDDVDNFVDNYTDDATKPQEDCSRFHAGEIFTALRSKGKNQLFDEKGVFGRVCRHDFPKGFLNLKHGERISYSVYELKKMREELGHDSKLIVMYDIACLLEKHLKASNQTELIHDVGLAVPIFHCYGHKTSCQLQYSPRRVQGVGLTDGEGVERLWAYLRNFSSITKEMGSERRIDALSDALIYYGQQLVGKYGQWLKDKLSRGMSSLTTVTQGIEGLANALSVNCSLDIINVWKAEELVNIKPKEDVLELLWDEEYVSLLLQSQQLRNEIVSADTEDHEKVRELQKKLNSKNKAVVVLEKKRGIRGQWKQNEPRFEDAKLRLFSKKSNALKLKLQGLAWERMFLLEMKKKYADGQSIAIKLSKQIGKASSAMKKHLVLFNSTFNVNATLKFDDVKDPTSALYEEVSSACLREDDVPQSTKRELIDLYCMKERCVEEISMVKHEMLRFFDHHIQERNAIIAFIRQMESTAFATGLASLLRQKLLVLNNNLCNLQRLWSTSVYCSPFINECQSCVFFSGIELTELVKQEEDIEVDEDEVDGSLYESDDSDNGSWTVE